MSIVKPHILVSTEQANPTTAEMYPELDALARMVCTNCTEHGPLEYKLMRNDLGQGRYNTPCAAIYSPGSLFANCVVSLIQPDIFARNKDTEYVLLSRKIDNVRYRRMVYNVKRYIKKTTKQSRLINLINDLATPYSVEEERKALTNTLDLLMYQYRSRTLDVREFRRLEEKLMLESMSLRQSTPPALLALHTLAKSGADIPHVDPKDVLDYMEQRQMHLACEHFSSRAIYVRYDEVTNKFITLSPNPTAICNAENMLEQLVQRIGVISCVPAEQFVLGVGVQIIPNVFFVDPEELV